MIGWIALASLGYGAFWWLRKRSHYLPAKSGDRLETVAERYGTTLDVLLSINGPGFARIYAPDGSPVAFKLPPGIKDGGSRPGAAGRIV